MARLFSRDQRQLPEENRAEPRSLTAPSRDRSASAPQGDWQANVFSTEAARVRNQTNLANPNTAQFERHNRASTFYDEIDGISNASQVDYNRELTLEDLVGEGSPARRRAPGTFTDFSIADITSAIAERTSDITDFVGSSITVAKDSSQAAIGNIDDVLRRNIDTTIPKVGFEFNDEKYTPSFVNKDGLSGRSQNEGASSSKLPNPLREHNHFTYVITLGILSPGQYNSPSSYRDLGNFDSYILKSGGGYYDRRYQVADEVVNGSSEHAEYYIEDLEIDAVIAPNSNTGVALGTTVSFTVIEPFSMGNFIQAIIGASSELGWGAYTDAPFCLKIEFVGWDENGQRSVSYVGKPAYIPILLTKVDFGVSGKGSAYEVEAVAYSESGLRDEINTVKTSINASGSTVHEVLTTNRHSVTTVLNERIEELEDQGAIIKGDRYIICFPKDPSEITRIVEENTRDVVDAASISVSTNVSLFEKLMAFATDESKMNVIGLSTLVDDVSEGSDHPHPKSSDVYDSVNDIWWRVGPDEHTRNFQTGQNETITHIIDKVILESAFGEDKPVENRNDGLKEWFRVNTQVFIDPDAASLQQAGRQPKIYVYAVIPYFPDEAKTIAPTERPRNTEGLKQVALKTYDYIYSGKNEDVLSFDLNFNNAFYQTAFADFGMYSGAESSAGSNRTTLQNSDRAHGAKIVDPSGALLVQREVTGSIETVTDLRVQSHGMRSVDVKSQIAEMFHDRLINQPVDMITAEMTIVGDPFFIPQQTGNYTGSVDRNNPNVISDGTIAYLQNEIFTVVNFRTPFDYQVKGASMEFPAIVNEFSGLFSVWAVTNTFSRGQFTQVLKLIRRRGQTDSATTGTGFFITPDDNVVITDYGQLMQSVQNLVGSDSLIIAPREELQVASGYAQENAPDGTFGPLHSPITQIGPLVFDSRQNVFESQPKASLAPAQSSQPVSEVNPQSNRLEEWNFESNIDRQGGVEGYRASLNQRALNRRSN